MARVRVKICGVTNEADAVAAAEFGADAIGLNFYPPSPRHVEHAAVAGILRALPPFVEPVGVFAKEPITGACELMQRLGRIRVVQWHGDEHELRDVSPIRVISAFQVREQAQLLEIDHYLEACRGLAQLPAAILVDAQAPGQYGGTGRTAPWELLADFKPIVPLILAGGLTADNVAEAIRMVRPYAVDVASGIENAPGKKDADKMRRFIDNARGV